MSFGWLAEAGNRRLVLYWVTALALSSVLGQIIINASYTGLRLPLSPAGHWRMFFQGHLVGAISSIPWLLRAFYDPAKGRFSDFNRLSLWVRAAAAVTALHVVRSSVHLFLASPLDMAMRVGGPSFLMENAFRAPYGLVAELGSWWAGGSFYFGLLYANWSAGLRAGLGLSLWRAVGSTLGLWLLNSVLPDGSWRWTIPLPNLVFGVMWGVFAAMSDLVGRYSLEQPGTAVRLTWWMAGSTAAIFGAAALWWVAAP